MKTDKNSYIMNIKSKTKHMKLNTNENTEIIFVGNSRTVYHIDTTVFKNNNLKIYNYGVSDRTIYNYVNMTKNALQRDPKMIVISLKISDLYTKNYYFNRVSLSDIKAMIHTKQGFLLIKKAIIDYLKYFYSLVDYSDVINSKIQTLYDKFTPVKKIISTKVVKNDNSTIINNQDCDIFDLQYPIDKIVAKCTNGDGILFGNKLINQNLSHDFKKVNKKYIDLLNYIVDEIKKHNIKPIIVFEPIYQANYKYDIVYLQKLINPNIINLTDMDIPDIMWADNNHLNNKGRILYSNILAKKLNKVINENSSF